MGNFIFFITFIYNAVMKVEIVKYSAPKVTLRLLKHNKEVKIARLLFDRRYRTGVYEIVNPEVLPKVL